MALEKRWAVRASVLLASGVLLASMLSGCGKDEDDFKILERPGRVASINKETGVVEMWTYAPKYKKEIKITGTLAPNAEILINGATATVDDIKIDDQVMVRGKAVKSEGETKFIAEKVEVTRPVNVATPPSQPEAPSTP